MLIFKINVSPSMKKTKNSTVDNPEDELDEHCTAFVSFDLQSKEFLNYPFTVCGYYDGRHVCSHVLGFLLFIRCAQSCTGVYEEFESIVSENPISLQNTLTLFENVVFNDNRVKGQRKRRSTELTL